MKFLLTAASLAFLSSTAFAADVVYDQYEPEAPIQIATPVSATDGFSWAGGYAGVNAGFSGGKFKNPFNVDDSFFETSDNYNFDNRTNGFTGGVQGGYNWQFGNAVLGLETDFQYSGLKGNNNSAIISDFYAAGIALENKVEWFGTIRARLGYTPTERLLVYGTGGAAYGSVKTSIYSAFDDGADIFEGSSSAKKTRWGYAVGAGAEYAVSDNWTLKSEYLYTDLGRSKLFSLDAGDLSGNLDTKVNFHTVRMGLNYKF